jgi:hypothetical protein
MFIEAASTAQTPLFKRTSKNDPASPSRSSPTRPSSARSSSPAQMRLLGSWNWYLPSWLNWLPHLDAEGPAARAAG